MALNKTESCAPGISFSRKRGEIFIFHTTIQALDNPYFIRFLLNREKGCLAVQSTDKKEMDSFTVPEYKEGSWSFRIYSEPLLRILWEQLEWDSEQTYRCFGLLHQEYNLVEFDLNKADIVLEGEWEINERN